MSKLAEIYKQRRVRSRLPPPAGSQERTVRLLGNSPAPASPLQASKSEYYWVETLISSGSATPHSRVTKPPRLASGMLHRLGHEQPRQLSSRRNAVEPHPANPVDGGVRAQVCAHCRSCPRGLELMPVGISRPTPEIELKWLRSVNPTFTQSTRASD